MSDSLNDSIKELTEQYQMLCETQKLYGIERGTASIQLKCEWVKVVTWKPTDQTRRHLCIVAVSTKN